MSSMWIWRKSVQRFPRYFIHKQKNTTRKLYFCFTCADGFSLVDPFNVITDAFSLYYLMGENILSINPSHGRSIWLIGRLIDCIEPKAAVITGHQRSPDENITNTRMWANAQRDGRPAEHRWCPLFNAAKFGWRPLLDCRAVTLPRRESRWN